MKDAESNSKFLSYILRHHPEAANLKLTVDGWANIDDIVRNTKLSRAEIERIVETDAKKRYSILNGQIRANQGHSVSSVKMKFKTAIPPVVLYHGASNASIIQIMKDGLKPMNRHHVHLSEDLETAQSVGGRRKNGFIILEIDCKSMLADGHKFYLSDNNVWLAEAVPAKYLKERT